MGVREGNGGERGVMVVREGNAVNKGKWRYIRVHNWYL